MKRILKLILCGVLTLSLTACNSDDKKLDNKPAVNLGNIEASEDYNTNNVTDNETLNEDETQEDSDLDTQACTPGNFDEAYSYYYATLDECTRESQSTAFFDITDNIDDRVFTVNCDEIVDECGTTWYGVSYNIYDPANSTREDGVVVVHY